MTLAYWNVKGTRRVCSNNMIKILSLFDGIGVTGLAAKAVFPDQLINVYAFENDTVLNGYPYSVPTQFFGDILDYKYWQSLEGVDYLFAGSPCQSFSPFGKCGGFDDPRGKLLVEAAKIKDLVKPKYWCFENVKGTNQNNNNKISEILGVEPVEINARLFTIHDRKRLYWANFPITLPNKPLRTFKYGAIIKRRAFGEDRYTDYVPCLTKNIGTVAWQMKTGLNGEYSKLPLYYFDTVQGLPQGYTAYLRNVKRRQALANAFTKEVVEHIFTQTLDV